MELHKVSVETKVVKSVDLGLGKLRLKWISSSWKLKGGDFGPAIISQPIYLIIIGGEKKMEDGYLWKSEERQDKNSANK